MFLLFLVLFSNAYAQDQKIDVPEKKVELVVGMSESFRVDFVPLTQTDPESPKFVTVLMVPQKREVTFNPERPGTETVTLRDAVTKEARLRYILNVTLTEKSRIIQELREFLKTVEGIKIGVIGDNVFISGFIVVPSDIGLVVAVLKRYDKVMNLVELAPQTQLLIAKKMQEDLEKNNLRNVRVRVVNGKFLLEGVAGAGGRQTAFDIASLYLPDKIESLARRQDAVGRPTKEQFLLNFVVENTKKEPGPLPKMIKITAQFVELTKDYSKVFGFKWGPVLGAGGGSIQVGKKNDGTVATGSSGTLSAIISNLFPKLQSAKNAGYARVIQSGIIIVEDGKDANLKKGTSQSSSVGSGEFTQAVKTEAGFDLNIRPEILRDEKIKLTTSISVKSTVGVSQAPEVQENSLKTELVVNSKESAAVGGVVTSKASTEFDKLPADGLGEGESFLFNFVRSKNIVRDKSQFVIFITPEIIENASAGTEDIKQKFKRRAR